MQELVAYLNPHAFKRKMSARDVLLWEPVLRLLFDVRGDSKTGKHYLDVSVYGRSDMEVETRRDWWCKDKASDRNALSVWEWDGEYSFHLSTDYGIVTIGGEPRLQWDYRRQGIYWGTMTGSGHACSCAMVPLEDYSEDELFFIHRVQYLQFYKREIFDEHLNSEDRERFWQIYQEWESRCVFYPSITERLREIQLAPQAASEI